jgi:hypothetical protein
VNCCGKEGIIIYRLIQEVVRKKGVEHTGKENRMVGHMRTESKKEESGSTSGTKEIVGSGRRWPPPKSE